MTTILNVGLAVNDGSAIEPAHALAALRARLGVSKLLGVSVAQSDTEPTLIVELNQPLSAPNAFDLSRALRQDCIAQWNGEHGELYGPAAWRWEPFNPAFFLCPDGSRLAAEQAA